MFTTKETSFSRENFDLSKEGVSTPLDVEDLRASFGRDKDLQKGRVEARTSGEIYADTEQLARDGSALQRFINSSARPENDPTLRQMVYTAALIDPERQGKVAAELIQKLKAQSVDTGNYERIIAGVASSTALKISDISLEPRPTTSPPPRIREAEEIAGNIHAVPQNTLALTRNAGQPPILVTGQVYDCVVLTLWDQETQKGVLTHVPVGSTPNLTLLQEELTALGIKPENLKATIVGGADYALAPDPSTGRLVPTALLTVGKLEHELEALGVKEIQYDVVHSKQEKSQGRSNVALDTRTGETFYVHDPSATLPQAKDRGYNELQDQVTDLYYAS